MSKLNEKEIITLFSSKLRINKRMNHESDDIVVVPLEHIFSDFDYCSSAAIVLKSDMLVESTDVPPRMRPWQIARKSIVACVSDMCAKGIEPPYLCLISVGIPSRYSKRQIIDLIGGLKIASKEFDVKIVGGDTNKSSELVINCNLASVVLGHKMIPRRSGAKPGDFVISSGVFGYSSSGLKILLNKAKAKGQFKRIAIRSVLRPEPQLIFGTHMSKFFSSSIDSSDGLAASLYELAKQSEVDLIIDYVPSAKGVQQFARDNHLAAIDLIFYGGEEYEIIATISKVNLKMAMRLAEKLKLKFHVIGRVEKGEGKVTVLSRRGTGVPLREGGYIHRFER
jgi:thiamine-monophosphate kinase